MASGWFRGSVMLYKMDLLCIDADVFSVVNIRLDLNGYALKKRHRKIKRQVEQKFSVTCGRARVSADRQRLYEQHKSRFKGFIHATLDEYLHAGFRSTVFDTMEICVFDQDKLIAASYFDLGEKSMASLIGMYDTAYAEYSLGIYTMLREIDFGLSSGRKYYYPGYVLDQPSAFDYKLTLGTMECYTPTKRWGKHANFNPKQSLAFQLRESMLQLEQTLENEGIPFRKWYYPYFSMGYMPLWQNRFLHMPLVFELGHDLDGILIGGYCSETQTFQLAHVHPCPDEQHFINMEQATEFNDSNIYLSHLMEFGDVIAHCNLSEVIEFVHAWRIRPDTLPPSCN
ncbi:MAG: hypothetical protein P8K81_04185 [Flavobacteriales bacterium]|nr:hypothetical protein [Flavobacteriales bacterium]